MNEIFGEIYIIIGNVEYGYNFYDIEDGLIHAWVNEGDVCTDFRLELQHAIEDIQLKFNLAYGKYEQ